MTTIRAIIDNTPELVIKNVESLGSGAGCKYLVCIESHITGEYIAKQWKRKMPLGVKRGEVVVRF